MKWLRERLIEPEILDTVPPEAARASLADLIRLNRDWGGHSTLRRLMREAVADAAEPFSLLDVGAASGDMGRKVLERYPASKVTSLDRLHSHLAPAEAPKVAGDAFRLPFADGSFDYAFSSLFLHHFSNSEVVQILGEMRRVARRAVLVVDLHRRMLPYYFVPATRWLLNWDPITVHDAPASVAASFEPEELAGLASQAGLCEPRVRSHGFAYRVTMIARTR